MSTKTMSDAPERIFAWAESAEVLSRYNRPGKVEYIRADHAEKVAQVYRTSLLKRIKDLETQTPTWVSAVGLILAKACGVDPAGIFGLLDPVPMKTPTPP
jgi:hypothetical protein